MNKILFFLVVLLLIGGFPALDNDFLSKPSFSEKSAGHFEPENRLPNRAEPSREFGNLPLRFEMNRGQTASQVRFLSRGDGYSMFFTRGETILRLRKPKTRQNSSGEGKSAEPDSLRIKLAGAGARTEIKGEQILSGASNYFTGGDAGRWLKDVPNFARLRASRVYPGIDQVFYGKGRQLEYDFIVAPGADPDRINLKFEGADEMRIDRNGELVFSFGADQLRQRKPVVYQEFDDEKHYVASGYTRKDDGSIGFEIGEYDRSRPLIIDPVLVFSTYLGGSDFDAGRDITVDAQGNVFVTGNTTSINFPAANGVQTAPAGASDVFVTKISAAGDRIIYSTYVGGNAGDIGYGIDVDQEGNAYVTGTTGGTSGTNTFPTTANAFDRVFNSPDESFLFKLSAGGNRLLYSTFTGAQIGFEVKVNKATGEAFMTGRAGSGLPTTPGAFRTACQPTPCSSSAFVTKFNAAGSDLIYSTYIGPGTGEDLALDAEGSAYVAGTTLSRFFPVTDGAAQTTCTGCEFNRSDAFVTKLNATGAALVYSTYLGGSLDEAGSGIVVDRQGNAFVTGRTESSSSSSRPFPTTPGAFQTTSQGVPDAFVTKLNPAGTAFVYSTYLGGNVRDEAYSIAVDPLGSAHVTGKTRSGNYPLVEPFQSACTENGDCVFITSLNPTGTAAIFSTFFGQGQGLSVFADQIGNVYATGETFQGLANLPTRNPLQPGHGGGSSAVDAFVAKIQIQEIAAPAKTFFDFDGDGRADVSVFRPSNGVWYLQQSAAGFAAAQFGLATDKIVPADYDGDGRADIAVYRDGNWYLLRSQSGFTAARFGTAEDIPQPADFDADGRAELAVFRPSNGAWYILNPSNNQFTAVGFGVAEDHPVAADYTGDGRADIAVWRPSNGVWYVLDLTNNQFQALQFGTSGDLPVPGDYDGDRKTDFAVFRSSNGVWYLQQTTAGFAAAQFGIGSDIPVPADYDGDGRADIAVFRNGIWYLLNSRQGFSAVQFGVSADKPIPNSLGIE